MEKIVFAAVVASACGLFISNRRADVAKILIDLRREFPKEWLILSDSDGSTVRTNLVRKYLISRSLLTRSEKSSPPLLRDNLYLLLKFLRGHAPGELEVRKSLIEGAGQGLFARKHFRLDELICVYRGTKLSFKELLSRSKRDYVMFISLNCHIDAASHPSVYARYVNDNFDENLLNARFVKLKHYAVALVVASRDIMEGEEIYAAYGEGYWRRHKRTIKNNAPSNAT